VKRREVIKKIEQGAKDKGVSWALHGEGANHSIYMLAGKRIPIARHNEMTCSPRRCSRSARKS
jgi:hypothetical protein